MKIIVPKPVMMAMNALVAANEREFTLIGRTERVEDGGVRLLEFKIPKQESTTASTEVSGDDMQELMLSLPQEQVDNGEWNMWIHSHNTMQAFWSGTDDEQMDGFNIGPAPAYSLVLSTQGRKGAIGLCLDGIKLYDKDIPVEIEELVLNEEEEKARDILIEKRSKLKEQMRQLTLKIEGVCDIDILNAELVEKNATPTYKHFGKKDWSDYGDEDYTPYWKKRDKKQPSFFGMPDYKNLTKTEYTSFNKEYDKLVDKTMKHEARCTCKRCERMSTLWDYLYNYEGDFKRKYEETYTV